jgi:hypothetical protein
MTCREAETQIYGDQDVASSGARAAELQQHLQSCAACSRLSATLKNCLDHWRADADGVRTPDPQFEWPKIRRALTEDGGRSSGRRAWAIMLPAAAAAAIAAAVYVSGERTGPAAAQTPATATRGAVAPAAMNQPTVVFVDDKSGWTFVWSDDASTAQNI